MPHLRESFDNEIPFRTRISVMFSAICLMISSRVIQGSYPSGHKLSSIKRGCSSGD